MSDFGVRKCLLIKKVPREEMETQIVPQLHFKKAQTFLCKGKGEWEGQEVIGHS